MNWTMPYPWRSRSDSVRRINMSSEPGSESFFCALRPIPRILSLVRRDNACQVQNWRISRRKTISRRTISTGVKDQSARASGRRSGGDPVGREVAVAERSKLSALYGQVASNSALDFLQREMSRVFRVLAIGYGESKRMHVQPLKQRFTLAEEDRHRYKVQGVDQSSLQVLPHR